MPDGDRSDHFVPRVAYSTGLRLGRFFVEIIGALMGAHPRKGNRMSTAKADVLELLEADPEDDQTEALARAPARTTFARDYPHPTRDLSEAQADLWKALQEITAPTAKAEVFAALDRLPDSCTMEDILEELDEREYLRRALASAIYEPLVSQEEMEAWFEQWARE